MISLLILIFGAIISVCFFYHKKSAYWQSRGVPGPKPTLFYGNLKEISSKKAPRQFQVKQWTEQFGSFYGMYEGIHPLLVITDLDMIQELFLKKFNDFYARKLHPSKGDVDTDPVVNIFNARGNRWKRLRTISSPSFSNASLKKVTHTIEDSATKLVEFLEKTDGKQFDIIGYFHEYTLDVISRLAMGQKECTMFRNKWIKQVVAAFDRDLDIWPTYVMSGAPILIKPVNAFLKFLAARSGKDPMYEIETSVAKAVAERVREKEAATEQQESGDFIDLFLDSIVEDIQDNLEFKNKGVERVMTQDEVVAQCMVFLLAGFDTTANSLSYVTYEIAKHPEIMQKLQKEIDEVCTEESISFDDIGRLKYMEATAKEALRMYPLAANANARMAVCDTFLGDIKIEKGTYVAIDTLSVHYNKDIWGQDAEEFNPERWFSSDIKAHQFLSFGAGPRQCIGMRLAYVEEKMALAHILRRFNIRRGAMAEDKLKLGGALTVSPASVTIYLERRNN